MAHALKTNRKETYNVETEEYEKSRPIFTNGLTKVCSDDND